MRTLQSLCRTLRNSNSALTLLRRMSNVPENTVYGGLKPQNQVQRVTVTNLRQKHKKGEPITMMMAYDYPSTVHVETAGIDVWLMGDSGAMVVHRHDATLPFTVDEMLVHCRAWRQAPAACRGFAVWELRVQHA